MGAVGYTSGDPRKVDVAGDTMTGDLVLPANPNQALEAATRQYVDAVASGGPAGTVVAETTYSQAAAAGAAATFSRGDHTHGTPALPTPQDIGAVDADITTASALTQPLWRVIFSDIPAISDQNVMEVHYTSGGDQLTTWLNEIGHYRAEQRANTLYDNLITLIASNAAGTGRLIRFERRDGADVRQTTGGIDQDGLLESSYYTWTAFDNFGGNYTAAVTNGFGQTPYTLRARRISDDIAQLRGGITVGAAATVNGDVMCNIAAPLRPVSAVMLNAATSGGAAATLVLEPDGDLVCRRGDVASGTFISLDGLTYTLVAGTG